MSIFDQISFLNRKTEKHLVRISSTGAEKDAFYFDVDLKSDYSIYRAFSMFHAQSTIHVIVFKSGVNLRFWKKALDSHSDFNVINNMILAESVFKCDEAAKTIKAFA